MGPASVDRYPSGSACRLRRLPRGAVGAAPGGAPPSRDRCTSAGAMKPFTSAQFVGCDTPELVDVSPHSVHKTVNSVRRRPLPPNHIHAGQPGFPVMSKIAQSRRGRSASTSEHRSRRSGVERGRAPVRRRLRPFHALPDVDRPSDEGGHREYLHGRRLRDRVFDLHVEAFGAIHLIHQVADELVPGDAEHIPPSGGRSSFQAENAGHSS